MGIKTLRTRLSEYVRLAAGGETVLVTDRDRVIAELRPPRAEPAEVRLTEAVREVRVVPAITVAEAPPPRRLPLSPLADMLGDREDDGADRLQ